MVSFRHTQNRSSLRCERGRIIIAVSDCDSFAALGLGLFTIDKARFDVLQQSSDYICEFNV